VCVTNNGVVDTEELKIVDHVQYNNGEGWEDIPDATQTIIPEQQLAANGGNDCYQYGIEFSPPGQSEDNYRNVAEVTITNNPGHEGQDYGVTAYASFNLPGEPTITDTVDASATVNDSFSCPDGFTCNYVGEGVDGTWTFDNSNLDGGSATANYQMSVANAGACTQQNGDEVPQQFDLSNTATLTEGDTQTTSSDSADVGLNTDACPLPATLFATKIVCNNEADLPDWAAGGFWDGDLWVDYEINSETAQAWVDSHQSCHIQSGWNFQYNTGYEIANPGDNSGADNSEEDGWQTFGPTDSSGTASVSFGSNDIPGELHVREVTRDDYIPFTGVEGSNVSAEFYCHKDVNNYDNFEFVGRRLEAGTNYYCVAWNVPKAVDACTHDCGSGNGGDDLPDQPDTPITVTITGGEEGSAPPSIEITPPTEEPPPVLNLGNNEPPPLLLAGSDANGNGNVPPDIGGDQGGEPGPAAGFFLGGLAPDWLLALLLLGGGFIFFVLWRRRKKKGSR
jgi:hypothetical protein